MSSDRNGFLNCSAGPSNVQILCRIQIFRKVMTLNGEEGQCTACLDNFLSRQVTVEVNPEYHPKIIGRSGGIINKLRKGSNFFFNSAVPVLYRKYLMTMPYGTTVHWAERARF